MVETPTGDSLLVVHLSTLFLSVSRQRTAPASSRSASQHLAQRPQDRPSALREKGRRALRKIPRRSVVPSEEAQAAGPGMVRSNDTPVGEVMTDTHAGGPRGVL